MNKTTLHYPPLTRFCPQIPYTKKIKPGNNQTSTEINQELKVQHRAYNCIIQKLLSTIRYSTEHHKVNKDDTKPINTIQHQNLINLLYTIRLYKKYIVIQSHELEQKYCQVFALARRDSRPIDEMSGNSG